MACEKRYKLLMLSLLLMASFCANAKTVFVAVNGSDTNTGTIDFPFATIQHAQSQVSAGDTVYIRGGTYRITESQIARYESIWAKVTYLDKSGTQGNRIKYWAYPGEEPIFDLQDITPANYRIHAFAVAGSWIHIKGITVIGVQVTILEHTQSVCFYNTGSNNIYEQLIMRDGQAIGIYAIKSGGNNLFLNCDAYNNWDYTSEDGRGGNVDGFGVHVYAGATGNVFNGCRAWFNSDDGFDCINTAEPAVFKNCWAMYNGYTPDFTSRGDGNGFKVGGYAYAPASELPNPIPRHITFGCIAVGNKANGFYANHQVGGNDWYFNSAYNNGNNYNMLSRLADPPVDTDGYDHYLENNLAHRSNNVTNIDTSLCTLINNTFDASFGGTVSDGSFMSLDESQLIAARKSDGSLPEITFLKPVTDSGLEGMGYFARPQMEGDINNDGSVDLEDLKLLTDQWLQSPGVPSADIAPPLTGDGEVNMLDFALLAENWTGPDTIPPAAPTGFSAMAGFGNISLDWDHNSEVDLDHYVVYRSTISGSDYSIIDANVATSNYVDNTVSNDTTYYYVVTAVDNSNNESDNSVEDSAAPLQGVAPSLAENSFGNTDAQTGISTSKTYTHKVDLIAATPAAINGVTFDAGTSGNNPSLNYILSGPSDTRTGMDSPAIAGSGLHDLLSCFVYKGNNGDHTLTLSGLTGGATYTLRLYVGGYSGRTFTFHCDNPLFTQAGLDRGLGDSENCGSFDFTYTLAPDDTDIAINIVADDANNVFHWYGFTNELVTLPD